MSAIFGMFHPDGSEIDKKYLLKMKEATLQYGKDKQEIYIKGRIGLGGCFHKSETLLEETAIVYDKINELVLICDATIYNYHEIFEACHSKEAHYVSTQELLLNAYLKWGEGCVKYLNGDFTFAVWDIRQQKLRIFRDHLGVRPMYYFYNTEVFAFATDYRALLSLSFVPKTIDKTMLYATLSDTYHIDTQSTYFEAVKRLPQAHYQLVDKERMSIKKYWSPGSSKPIIYSKEEEYQKHLFNLVVDAIKLRIKQSTGKVASEFSAGLDSSVVTVLANIIQKREGKELEAYSWSPSPSNLAMLDTDERAWILKVADREGFACRFREHYQSAKEVLDCEPALTNGQRSEELRQIMQEMNSDQIKTVLSGWGGDEGISHRADYIELLLHGEIGHFISELRYLARGSVLRFLKLLISVPLVLLCRPYSFFGRQNKEIPCILKKRFKKAEKKKCKRDILKLKVNPVQHLESGVTVSRTELIAWISADYQMQYLFPFLDFRLVDFAMSIPRHLFFKQGQSRYIYRKAFSNILPKEICNNASKIDISREQYWKEHLNMQAQMQMVLERIDQEMFEPYIDWQEIKEMVASNYFTKQSRGSIFTYVKIMAIYDISRMIKEVRDY